MVIVGLPFTESALTPPQRGGSPYGATHVAGSDNAKPVSEDEIALAFSLGKRLAEVAQKLAR